MKVRKSINRNVTSALLAGALLSLLSFNASADSTFSVDARSPLAVTLMPSVKVTASLSNPSIEVRWSVSSERALQVTLMPTVTVTADIVTLAIATLPTVTVIAEVETLPMEGSPALALAPSAKAPMLGVSN